MADNIIPFNISLIGDTTQEKWLGDFKAIKNLGFRAQMAQSRIRREYLGDLAQYASEDEVIRATVFSDLAVSLADSPKWWKEANNGVDLQDWNVVEAVYLKIQDIRGLLKKEEAQKTKADAEVLKKAIDGGDAKAELANPEGAE